MLISNADIRTYCKIGFNVSAADTYIQDAQDELERKLPATLFARFEVVETYSAWAIATAYVVGNYVTYAGSLWKCLVNNTGSAPASDNTNWDLQDIYVGFLLIQKSLAYSAYSKFLVEHGIEVQGSGLVKYSGADSQTAVSASERAALVNKYKNKGDAAFMEFLKWIDDASYEVDGVEYLFTSVDIIPHKNNFGIF